MTFTGNQDEWAALHANQHEAAKRIHKHQTKNKRDLLTNQYGKGEYLNGKARVQEEKD